MCECANVGLCSATTTVTIEVKRKPERVRGKRLGESRVTLGFYHVQERRSLELESAMRGYFCWPSVAQRFAGARQIPHTSVIASEWSATQRYLECVYLPLYKCC